MFLRFCKNKFLTLLVFLLFFLGFGNLNTNAYTNGNTTELFKATILEQTSSSLKVQYNIIQDFKLNSHGIFLSLPKNNNGVWVEHSIDNVVKKAVTETSNNAAFIPEEYQQIKEFNEFRIRIGDPQIATTGRYEYQFVVNANFPVDTFVKLTLMQGWLDPINQVEVFDSNGQNICNNSPIATCSNQKIFFKTNGTQSSWLNNAQVIFYQLLPYIIATSTILGVFYGLWSKIARDPARRRLPGHPVFEPPKGILPWEADFIINDGQSDFKNTFLSYVLFLNHYGSIKILPVQKNTQNEKILTSLVKRIFDQKDDQIKLEIIKELPNGLLPEIFNIAINAIAQKGFQKGLLESKISPQSHQDSLHIFIKNRLKNLHDTQPLSSPLTVFFVLLFGLGFLLLIFSNTLQKFLLIGNSYIVIIWFSFLITLILSWFLARYWGKLNNNGAMIRDQLEGYRYYLNYVEKYKLDFSNNPTKGVQYYLATVPFAAALGVMPQFREYITKILPNSSEINNTTLLFNNWSSSNMYSPSGSSSSGGGGSSSGGGFSGGGGSW